MADGVRRSKSNMVQVSKGKQVWEFPNASHEDEVQISTSGVPSAYVTTPRPLEELSGTCGACQAQLAQSRWGVQYGARRKGDWRMVQGSVLALVHDDSNNWDSRASGANLETGACFLRSLVAHLASGNFNSFSWRETSSDPSGDRVTNLKPSLLPQLQRSFDNLAPIITQSEAQVDLPFLGHQTLSAWYRQKLDAPVSRTAQLPRVNTRFLSPVEVDLDFPGPQPSGCSPSHLFFPPFFVLEFDWAAPNSYNVAPATWQQTVSKCAFTLRT
ncbi:hypothetical protein EDB92DRAFT_2107241 [Lactarius akahatsu]|uniref:Uncharacterized protein n=1 Tax=Lactarius akahatsu TaxID=416441 RepID=A0AAD4Q8B6_9AGAM|nr:hypothetical protein EDB92DRAFT_2107241 [Lactarius akahatsu]